MIRLLLEHKADTDLLCNGFSALALCIASGNDAVSGFPAILAFLLIKKFCPKMSALYICCIYPSALQSRFFFMEANNVNPV